MKTPKVSAKAIQRIWGADGYRLFLSHKSGVSKQTNKLKESLRLYGVSAFVAHTSIRATLEWQNEIENALHTMDALAALMTEDFHESNWTDQEVGFALGRNVPIVPVRMGHNPYGFLARIQGLSCKWDNAAERIVEILIQHEGMVDAYIQAIRDCDSYDNSNVLARILPSIEELDDDRMDELVDAYNGNSQVYDSYGFNGGQPHNYGAGLVPYLHRLGSRRFEMVGKRIRLASGKKKARN